MARRGRSLGEIHFDLEIPGEDIKSCMSKKYRWRKDWAYCYSLERLLTEEHLGETLNFPCGFSSFGDVRADIDPQTRPHVVCDLRHPPFRDGSFDTVHSDPPYSTYNRPGYLVKLFDIARRRVILDDLPLDWKPGKRWRRKWAMLTRTNGLLLKWATIYDKYDHELPEYCEES